MSKRKLETMNDDEPVLAAEPVPVAVPEAVVAPAATMSFKTYAKQTRTPLVLEMSLKGLLQGEMSSRTAEQWASLIEILKRRTR
jgi:hypothetical protein